MTIARLAVGDTNLSVEKHGRGAPLLLVHGFPLDHTMWCGQLDELARSHTVIAPDLRGFGASDPTHGDKADDDLTMERLADDLAMLLDALEIREPVALCGLSMGGYVAWQFWQRHRERLSKLVVCDTRAAADSEEAVRGRLETAERVLSAGSSMVADAMMGKLFSPRFLERQPDRGESIRRVMLTTRPETIAAALRGMAAREDFTSRLPEIDLPTLVVCGTQDGISPVDEMRGIAAVIPAARFIEIGDAGHMAPFEQPAVVNRALTEFLSE